MRVATLGKRERDTNKEKESVYHRSRSAAPSLPARCSEKQKRDIYRFIGRDANLRSSYKSVRRERRGRRGIGSDQSRRVLRGLAAMSAGVCGKRLGFEDIFGSPAPKRSRCGSPVPDFDFATGDKFAVLLRMFPSMDREVVETVLNTHDQNIDDAIRSLHALCLGNESVVNELANLNPEHSSSDSAVEGDSSVPKPGPNVEDIHNGNSEFEYRMPLEKSSWVDLFLQEMMNASDWDDVRGRAMRFLEAFEKSVVVHSTASKEEENASLKEQLQCLLRDNQILKRAVAIQHERNLEHEEKLKEVEQLKHIISQYQDQVRTLELNNYTLKIHLQRAQEANSIPNRFHPDIF